MVPRRTPSFEWPRAASRSYRASFALALAILCASLLAGFATGVSRFGLPPIDGDATVLGRQLLERGDYVGAFEEFRLARRIDPERVAAMPEISVHYETHSDPTSESRIRRLQDRLRAEPRNARVHLALGRELLARGDATASLPSLERARELDPALAGVQASLGRAYLIALRSPEAEQAFRAALREEPSRAALHEGLGVALYWLGHFEEAIDELQRAQRLTEASGERRGRAGE